MPDPQRLEFVTRHFSDLQTIRFAPAPIAMILIAAAQPMPHVGRIAAWSILLIFLSAAVGFYRWSTAAIRRHYGSVQVSAEEKRRMERNPMIVALRIALGLAALLYLLFPLTSWSDFYLAFTVLLTLLRTILDSTNPASRRIAWGLGLVILFGASPILFRFDNGAPLFVLAGATWLGLSVFDFVLLRRSLSYTSPMVRYG